ncbi:16S rRNA (guanine(527)-N(7))-methyltransferase RsmG [Lentibacillus cibarius]|uniref:Ribosomal RNA small subunit methyltransferase G n=1 Tax=Lentibacillus cibarius TaxID=2583219 RepID=A0A5S3QM08_9BACI|nr:16S rRNA (guanine(527)-N(7))-methyltransferase RsmG [Lentibacillus cibarius]TMN22271.1 16S rRNA (guanine(527)-N(7))-methyltransferase RsmG [Lentibacillus cibarius]
MTPEQFKDGLHERDINISPEQAEQFETYFQTLVEWNKKINLTTLTAKEDVYLKHFYDSISAAFYYDFTGNSHICDVGAGAGFPSIPLKICFPELQVTIVDSLKKRIHFLEQLATNLNLTGIAFYHDRAENFAANRTFRESFDIVMARAVAKMSVLSELCLPLAKKHGTFIAMKGASAEEEVTEAKNAFKTLGGELVTTHSFQLPQENSDRSIVILHKVHNTPKKYPRKPGTPAKKPIT